MTCEELPISEVIDNLIILTQSGLLHWSTPYTKGTLTVRCSQVDIADLRTVVGHINTRIGNFELNLLVAEKPAHKPPPETAHKLIITFSENGRSMKSDDNRLAVIYNEATSKSETPSLLPSQYLLYLTEDIIETILR